MISRCTIEQFPELVHMAQEFQDHAEAVTVDPQYTIEMYSDMIKDGTAAAFILWEDDKMVGAICGINAPDLHFPRKIAVETFWFVLPEHRGKGLGLMNAFEKWAEEEKCNGIAMVHLMDSYPEVLEKIYKKKGYSLIEKHWLKVIS